jgi:hypothetical protein
MNLLGTASPGCTGEEVEETASNWTTSGRRWWLSGSGRRTPWQPQHKAHQLNMTGRARLRVNGRGLDFTVFRLSARSSAISRGDFPSPRSSATRHSAGVKPKTARRKSCVVRAICSESLIKTMAAVTLTDNASNSPQTVNLSGTAMKSELSCRL